MNTITINISGPAMMILIIIAVTISSVIILEFFNNRIRKQVEEHRQENIELMQKILHKECDNINTGSVKEAMDVIKLAMVEDNPSEPGSYAHSWHCNIAMMCSDAIHAAGLVEGGPLSKKAPSLIGNDAASRFMRLCFDVETKQ